MFAKFNLKLSQEQLQGQEVCRVQKPCFCTRLIVPASRVLLLSPYQLSSSSCTRFQDGQPNGLLGRQPCQNLVAHSLGTSAEYAARRLAFASFPLEDLPELLSYAVKDILILTVGFGLSMLTNHWIYVFIAQKIFTHHLALL